MNAKTATQHLITLRTITPTTTPDTHLHSPAPTRTHTRATPTLDQHLHAHQNFPHNIRALADLNAWAAEWCAQYGLTHHTDPLIRLAHETPVLEERDPHMWDTLTREITRILAHITHLAGYTPRHLGPCPICKTRNVTQNPTKNGYAAKPVCENCKTTWQTASHWKQSLTALELRALKTWNTPGLYLKCQELTRLHPQLSAPLLAKWKQRDHIIKTEHGYDLASVNARIAREHNKKYDER
ncbi:hypothetical protein [Schaalia sp. lx-100]|uniref:hypothetical protein n=1 Tax=Schaalia sp. lx-100 TaxID=2899081 RepID=UPI001E541EF6|nr:hypothetical protein [Schaalia sp. lx-100]MCD4557627.1 hypothetical protein [Schaalia sp. lx-100]